MGHQLSSSPAVRKAAIPIYRAVADDLRDRILSGKLAAGEQLPSEEELSAQFGISHLTLRKGLKILSELKLITQSQGKGTFVSYRKEGHLRIGIVVGDLSLMSSDIYVLRMISGLSRALNIGEQRGELILIDSAVPGGLANRIHQYQCEAVISIDTTQATLSELRQEIAPNLPTVSINADRTGKADWCDVCAARGIVGYAVRHLYAQGHRKIAYISAYGNPSIEVDNRDFLECCRELAIPDSYFRCETGHWYDTVLAATRDLCAMPDRPTAFVTPGFTFSYAAWEGIIESGLRIPDDISFIGFDVNRNSNPRMSAMIHPFEKLAQKAVELIFEQKSRGAPPKVKHYEFHAEFADNGSCRACQEHSRSRKTRR